MYRTRSMLRFLRLAGGADSVLHASAAVCRRPWFGHKGFGPEVLPSILRGFEVHVLGIAGLGFSWWLAISCERIFLRLQMAVYRVLTLEAYTYPPRPLSVPYCSLLKYSYAPSPDSR
jgi:hypothetical protein